MTDFFDEPPAPRQAVYLRADDIAQYLGASVEEVLIAAVAQGFRVRASRQGSVIGVERQKALAVRRRNT